jgi:hypothetical protein
MLAFIHIISRWGLAPLSGKGLIWPLSGAETALLKPTRIHIIPRRGFARLFGKDPLWPLSGAETAPLKVYACKPMKNLL